MPWSSADNTTIGGTLSNSNNTVTFPNTGGSSRSIRNTTSQSSGKWYVEVLITTLGSNNDVVGMANAAFTVNQGLGASSTTSFGVRAVPVATLIGNTSVFTANYTPSWTWANGDVIGLAVSWTNSGVWVAQNNVWASPGNPSTNTSPMITLTSPGALLFGVSDNNTGTLGVFTLQSTASSQKYAAPTGFTAWDGSGAIPQAGQGALMA